MNATILLPVLGVLFCGGAPQPPPSSCAALGPETREAIAVFLRANLGVGDPLSEDQHEIQGASKVIRDHPESLACLAEIFRHGIGRTGLWTYESEAPSDGRWVIEVVRSLDSATAITLYREWRADLKGDVLTRTRIDVELTALGDPEFLPDVASFLMQPPAVSHADQARLRLVQERAVEVISMRNYRPALKALQRLTSEGPAYVAAWKWLPVFTAQLADDEAAILRFAQDPELFSWALQALKRMGKDDVLQRLADDRQYRYRSLAKTLLQTHGS